MQALTPTLSQWKGSEKLGHFRICKKLLRRFWALEYQPAMDNWLMSIPIGYDSGSSKKPRTANVLPQSASSATQPLDPAALMLAATIAEAGSLTAAARKLGLSQPALTKQLHRVEQALGVPLFTRSTRGIAATEYALALLPRARTIRDQAVQAGEELAQLRGSREGRVTIALSHVATIAFLPEVMRRFRREWPEVQVCIGTTAFPDQFAGLREGTPDFAVVPLPVEPLSSEYQARPLYTSSMAVVVRAGHKLEGARQLAELIDADWLLPSLTSTSAVALRRAFERQSLSPPRCLISCETLTGIETLVLTSDLVGVVPVEVYEARAAASGLRRLALQTTLEGPSLALIRWADGQPTPAARRLAELFVETAHGKAKKAKPTAARAARLA